MALTEVKRLVGLLEQDHEDVEALAEQVLALVDGMRQEKARYTVVGRLWRGPDGREYDRDEQSAVALGWFSTEKKALAAAIQLGYSNPTGEEARVEIVPVWHGTAAKYYAARKVERELDALASKSDWETEVKRRVDWCADHPGEPLPPEWSITVWGHRPDACPECEGTGKLYRRPAEETGRRGGRSMTRAERVRRVQELRRSGAAGKHKQAVDCPHRHIQKDFHTGEIYCQVCGEVLD